MSRTYSRADLRRYRLMLRSAIWLSVSAAIAAAVKRLRQVQASKPQRE